MINRTKVEESTQINPGSTGYVLVMKDQAPEWAAPSEAGLAEQAKVDAALAEKQDKLVAGDNIHIVGNTISADGKPTPIAIGTVTSGEVPMVSNSGTNTDVILNFVLPKGDKGDKGDQGIEGPQGPVGAPFQVKKIYDSVEAMNADYSGSDVAVGEFVLIDTGNVQDPDNSKLYVKGTTQYDFVTDLSGAQGIQGPQGDPGTPAGFGNITATVDSTVGTPQVSVQSDGPNTAKNISFSFTGLKGEKGEKGEAGTQINSILPLTVETPPDEGGGTGNILFGDNVRVISSGAFRGVGIGANVITGHEAVSIGSNANASTLAIAIGPRSHAEGYGSNTGGIALGENARTEASAAVAIGANSSVTRPSGGGAQYSVALGPYSTAKEEGVVSVGSGVTTLTLSDDMTEAEQAVARLASDVPTRRIINVTDPRDAQDAATKAYVDSEIAKISSGTQVNNIAPALVERPPIADGDGGPLAIGEGAVAKGGGIAISEGGGCYAYDPGSIAIGNAQAGIENGGGSCIAIGWATAENSSIAIGQCAAQNNGIAIGNNAGSVSPEHNDEGSIYIGNGSGAMGSHNLVIGLDARGEENIVMSTIIGNGARIISGGIETAIENAVAIGSSSKATSANEFSIGNESLQRRITHVSTPVDGWDVATKNYVDTQLEPINAKLQYVPENTNQILSQIQTNVEKAQSAADAKVASITAGTGISVDASNPTAPVVNGMIAVPDYANGAPVGQMSPVYDGQSFEWTAPQSGVVFLGLLSTQAAYTVPPTVSINGNQVGAFVQTWQGGDIIEAVANYSVAKGDVLTISITDASATQSEPLRVADSYFYPYKFVEIS